MLRRKIMDILARRQERQAGGAPKKCLLLKGARQTGKTFILREFGRTRYPHVAEINFEERPEMRRAFAGDLDVDTLVRNLSLFLPDVRFLPGETLLFFDEIQACPQARTSLKFWAQDGRFDVVASGSLLGLNSRDVASYPVGYEQPLEMHSLDFEEFLWAQGVREEHIAPLRAAVNGEAVIPAAVHRRMLALLRQYMVVGGMPAVVNRFLAGNSFGEVHEEQEAILQAYADDMGKYAAPADRPKIRACYFSLPRQLAKEYAKFQFSVVEKRGTARKFGAGLEWLGDANLVRFCRNTSAPLYPLAAYARDDQFKLYAGDIGLLVAMYGFDMKAALMHDTLTGPAKGGIYENLAADIFLKRGLPLHYHRREDGSLEIEFLLEREGRVVPVEVKAGRGASRSLDRLLTRPEIPFGYKLTAGNAGKSGAGGKKITLPLYLAQWL